MGGSDLSAGGAYPGGQNVHGTSAEPVSCLSALPSLALLGMSLAPCSKFMPHHDGLSPGPQCILRVGEHPPAHLLSLGTALEGAGVTCRAKAQFAGMCEEPWGHSAFVVGRKQRARQLLLKSISHHSALPHILTISVSAAHKKASLFGTRGKHKAAW